MNKIISLKKEITFKNTIEEIVSISMDHKLYLEDLLVKGDFVVEGEYLNLSKKEPFHFDIPYLGYLDEFYDTSEATVKVDDFYYEIIEPNKLLLSIDILVDKLSEKKLIEIEEDIIDINEEDRSINLDTGMEKEENLIVIPEKKEDDIIKDKTSEREILIFKDNYQEAYMTYRVYIVRDGDNIDTILDKYKITLDLLKKYNVINELAIGDKLIIPYETNK